MSDKAIRKAVGRRIAAGENKVHDTALHFAHLYTIDLTTHVTQNPGVSKTGNNAIGERRASNPQHPRKPSQTCGRIMAKRLKTCKGGQGWMLWESTGF